MSDNPQRALERYDRIKALGRVPPWWRPFARRRWIRSFESIMAFDISEAAEMLRGVYSQDAIARAADRPSSSSFALMRKAPRPTGASFTYGAAVDGAPGLAYECPVHGRFVVPSELPRHYLHHPEAKCTSCGQRCPPHKDLS